MSTLIIDAELSAPPSNIHCFRDIALLVKALSDLSHVLVRAERDHIDSYHKWLKANYAYDHIDGILAFDEYEPAVIVGCNIPCNYFYSTLNENNCTELVYRLAHLFTKKP